MVAPTLEPVEFRIVDDVRTTLEGISPANGSYYTTVKRVHLASVAPDGEGETKEMPCCVVVFMGATSQYYEGTKALENVFMLDVFCLMPKTPQWQRDIFRFVADVRRALTTTAHRGTVGDGPVNAFDTNFTEWVVANVDKSTTVASARLRFQVISREDFNDPTQAV